MKYIAENRYSGLGRTRLTLTVFAFSIFVATFGMNFVYDLHKVIDATDRGNLITTYVPADIDKLISIVLVSMLWALLVFVAAFLLEKISIAQATFMWPRYFFYVFEFSAQERIVGWTRINLDSSGKLSAEGHSFNAYPSFDADKIVGWTAQSVSSGSFKDKENCYILYNLDEQQAKKQDRKYRQGLLRFQELKKGNLKDPKKDWVLDSSNERNQYFGSQQAIERSGDWKFAYAELYCPIIPKRKYFLQALGITIAILFKKLVL
jgi:hypothetical protein